MYVAVVATPEITHCKNNGFDSCLGSVVNAVKANRFLSQ